MPLRMMSCVLNGSHYIILVMGWSGGADLESWLEIGGDDDDAHVQKWPRTSEVFIFDHSRKMQCVCFPR